LDNSVKSGLKRIATIGFNKPDKLPYYQRMLMMTKVYGVNFQDFSSVQAAREWMQDSFL
jgi:hypothetical protein